MAPLKVKNFQLARGRPIGYLHSGLLRTNPASTELGRGIELGASGLQFQRPNYSATLPASPSLPVIYPVNSAIKRLNNLGHI